MLARFDLEDELATAARGAVYRARDRNTGRIVAVKLAPRAVDRAFVAREHTPADACRRLRHAHIAATRDCGEHRGLAYSVTELADGVDLAQHTRSPHLLPLPIVLDAMEQVARALSYAHARGAVHGDVKPANIVFDDATRTAKLIDFPGGAFEGFTPAYAAPERHCGAAPSPASDRFSLGVTLFQLACGALPFRGSSRPQIVQRIVNEPHGDVREHAPALPGTLAAVIDTALAKKPAQRFPSTAAMAHALGALNARTRAL